MRKKILYFMTLLCVSLIFFFAPTNFLNTKNISIAQAASKRAGVANPSLSDKKLVLVTNEKRVVKLSGSSGKVKWESSDKKVASVDAKGTITAKGLGKAKIIAVHNGKKYSCTVNVIKTKLLASTTEVTCYQDTTILLKVLDAVKGEKIDYLYNKDIVDVEMGKWGEDDIIPMTLQVKDIGKTTITVVSNRSSQELKINVNVIAKNASSKTGVLTPNQIYAKSSTGTVQVNTDKGLGSGFFIEEGKIVTNYHVIEGATSIQIQTSDGTSYNVDKILGFDENIDIAILSIKHKGSPLKINKHGVTIGDDAYALGSSLGFKDTFTNGIVTNDNRIINGINYIQTNASISSGNSGGPLINKYGEVIGINTFTYVDGQNVNMAIEINQIYQISIFKPLTVQEFAEATKVDYIPEDETKSYSFETAQTIPLDEILSGSMTVSQKNMDIYKIDITEEGEYLTVFVAYPGEGQIAMAILNSNDLYNPIEYLGDDKDDTISDVLIKLTPGTYYIAIYKLDAFESSQDVYYDFGVTKYK